MATRSLLDVFLLMRKNSMQSRHIYSEQGMSERYSDRMSLVGAELGAAREAGDHHMPPAWADGLDEVHYALSKLRAKLVDIQALHTRHLHRPTLDESAQEETQVQALTQEITQLFGGAHRLVQHMRARSACVSTATERRLASNVVSSLVAALQDLSNGFRKAQTGYLETVRSREERSSRYFSAADGGPNADDGWHDDADTELDAMFGRPRQRMAQIEQENTEAAARREREVNHIVRSITDLHAVFKDLAHMVAEQGTVLDRIDYNVEQCQTQVHQGYVQLAKADSYQRKNRKMVCILVLAAATLFLLMLFIIVKT